MIIKWFPRSWVQIKAEEGIIYIDPSYISTYFKKYKQRIVFSDAEDDALPEDLEKGTVILISHIHKDQCKDVTINRLSNEHTVIFTPKKYQNELPDTVKNVSSGQNYQIGNILIEVVDAYNTLKGSSTRKVHKRGECVGYIITVDKKRIYFSGDTDLIPEMSLMPHIDIAIIPIGGIFTMDISEAIEASLILKPKLTIPIHHLKADPMEFKMRLEMVGLDAIVPTMGVEIMV